MLTYFSCYNETETASSGLHSCILHTDKETDESVDIFIISKINSGLWAVGCGLGWTVKKNVWANYEQLLRAFFSTFCGQNKFKSFFK